jgi:predicted permease
MKLHWRISHLGRRKELQEEISAHLQMAIADRVARGEPEQTARQAAMREFGNIPLVQDVTSETWGWAWLERLGQDFHYTVRQIRRSPGFAAMVIGTLALGIASTAAMFTVVDHALLRPVPYRDPHRLVLIQECDKGGTAVWPVPWLDIEQWIAQNRSFDQIAFSTSVGGKNFLEERTASAQIEVEQVSSNLFEAIGVQPALGRGFLPETLDFTAGKNAGSIVLSDAIWKEEFGADPGILGKRVKINDNSYTVIGVMPAGFRYPVAAQLVGQVWTPIELNENDRGRDYRAMRFRVLGRLRKDATLQSANADIAVVQKRVAEMYTDPQWRQEHNTARLQTYGDSLVSSQASTALLALFAASGVLWLIANLNVTNLLLARSTARQREIAMRGALGASRGRVVQQLMVEGLTFSGAAAVLGTALAVGSVKLLARELSQTLPLPVPSRPDLWILAILLILTFFSALTSSAWPAILAARAPIEAALRQGGAQSGTGRHDHRLREALVTVEIAMALLLLVACGMLLRTIYSLRHVQLGYRTDHLIVASLSIPSFRFAAQNMTVTLYEPLLQRVQHMHGVRSAGLMSEVPLSNIAPMNLGLESMGQCFPPSSRRSAQIFDRYLVSNWLPVGSSIRRILRHRSQ